MLIYSNGYANRNIPVNSLEQLKTAISNAVAGDRIVLVDGIYHTDAIISISAKTVEGHVSKIGDKGLVLSEELNESINRTRAGVVALIVEGIGNGELTHEWNGGEVTVSPREE